MSKSRPCSGSLSADALPDERGVRVRLRQPQHAGPAPLRGHEEPRPAADGGRHAHAHVDDVRHLPVDAARRRIERADRPRVPDDELRHPGRVDQERRRVARLPVGRQRLPEHVPGPLVEGDDLGVGLAPHQADEPVAVDERRSADAPRRDRGPEVAHVVLLPQDAAVVDGERHQVAHRPEGVDAIPVDGRRGPRPDRVGELQGRRSSSPTRASRAPRPSPRPARGCAPSRPCCGGPGAGRRSRRRGRPPPPARRSRRESAPARWRSGRLRGTSRGRRSPSRRRAGRPPATRASPPRATVRRRRRGRCRARRLRCGRSIPSVHRLTGGTADAPGLTGGAADAAGRAGGAADRAASGLRSPCRAV